MPKEPKALEFVYEGPRTWLGVVEEPSPTAGRMAYLTLVDAIEWYRVMCPVVQVDAKGDIHATTAPVVNPAPVECLTSRPKVRIHGPHSRVAVSDLNEKDQERIFAEYDKCMANAHKNTIKDAIPTERPRIIVPGMG